MIDFLRAYKLITRPITDYFLKANLFPVGTVNYASHNWVLTIEELLGD